MKCWHSGNKEEAEDGWPSGGCSPSPAPFQIQDVSPALRLASAGHLEAGAHLWTDIDATATPTPAREPQGENRPGAQGSPVGTAPSNPTPGTTGHLHPARLKVTAVRMKGPSTDSGRACLEILNV